MRWLAAGCSRVLPIAEMQRSSTGPVALGVPAIAPSAFCQRTKPSLLSHQAPSVIALRAVFVASSISCQDFALLRWETGAFLSLVRWAVYVSAAHSLATFRALVAVRPKPAMKNPVCRKSRQLLREKTLSAIALALQEARASDLPRVNCAANQGIWITISASQARIPANRRVGNRVRGRWLRACSSGLP